MSGSKTTNVSISTGGGALSIGGDANVGGIVEGPSSSRRGFDEAPHALAVEAVDVFISYSHPDRLAADAIAAAIEARGLKVWYDRELVAGDQFVREINARHEAARWVLVIWSASSLGSEWVLNEAEMARRRNALVAVSIDGSLPPAPFTLIHTPRVGDVRDAADPALGQIVTRLLER